jgi:hypothetical protein
VAFSVSGGATGPTPRPSQPPPAGPHGFHDRGRGDLGDIAVRRGQVLVAEHLADNVGRVSVLSVSEVARRG